MTSLNEFCVVFDNESATYESGEVVSGKIILDIKKDKYVKGIFFIANGSAHVHWMDNDPEKDEMSQTHASSQEYFNLKHEIFGIPECPAGHKIPYGRNEYPFSFRLPREIPCSFEHTTGYVRYTIKVIVERPLKYDYECKAAFTVISRLDLNVYREQCFGIHDETNKSFNCLCWIGQGTMSLQVMVPCSGYVPGQIVTTTIRYSSSPNIPITKFSTKLLRKAYFHTSSNKKTHKNTLKKNNHSQPFPENGQMTSELLIPPVAPSDLQYCGIIDIEYELVVSIHVSGPHSKIRRSYPLLIGTIPLYRPALTLLHRVVPCPIVPHIVQQAITSYPLSDPGQSSVSGIPIQDQANIPSDQLDIPPPTYVEGLSKTLNIRDMHESEFVFGVNIPFSPKYPVYNYPAPRLPDERL